MEKKRPTYDLVAVKAAFSNPGGLAITVSAFRDALALGFDRLGIVEIIQTMEGRMFVKSMTTHADHRVWQDVYNVPAKDVVLYVKFQADLVTEFRVMAFKEK